MISLCVDQLHSIFKLLFLAIFVRSLSSTFSRITNDEHNWVSIFRMNIFNDVYSMFAYFWPQLCRLWTEFECESDCVDEGEEGGSSGRRRIAGCLQSPPLNSLFSLVSDPPSLLVHVWARAAASAAFVFPSMNHRFMKVLLRLLAHSLAVVELPACQLSIYLSCSISVSLTLFSSLYTQL
jgi:hypothetical protein